MTCRQGIVPALFVSTLLFAAAPAHAQYTVFISGTGNNANDCLTPATACRSLTHAHATVNASGVIHMLPGQYGGATITKSVEIIADEGQVSMTTSAPFVNGVGATILINAGATDVVRVRGIVSSFPTLQASGVAVLSAGQVYVENCTFLNGNGSFGLVFRPSAGSKLVVSDTTIANNGAGGIEVRPLGTAIADVTINNTRILNNGIGISVVKDSNVLVRNSTVAGNTLNGVRANGAAVVVRMADSSVRKNHAGLVAVNGGQIISHRGNVVADNAINGAFTSTVNQQ